MLACLSRDRDVDFGCCICRDTFYDCEEGDSTHDKLFRRPVRQLRAHSQHSLYTIHHLYSRDKGKPCLDRIRPLDPNQGPREYVRVPFPWETIPEWKGENAPPQSAGFHWGRGSGLGFKMRPVGFDRKTSKVKIPSSGNLYECIGIEIIRAEYQIEKVIGRHMEVETTGNWQYPLPHTLVVNVQLPYKVGYPFGWHPKDDTGVSMVGFFRIKESTKRLLDSDDPMPCLRLFREYIKGCNVGRSPGYSTTGIMKTMAFCDNVDEMIETIPAWIRGLAKDCNGKPTLLTQSVSVFRDAAGEWVELGVDVRKFCYMARKALAGLRDRLPEASIRVGFMVQGSGDENLPEGIVCDLRLHYANLVDNIKWVD